MLYPVRASPFDEEHWQNLWNVPTVADPKRIEILPHEVQTAIGNPPQQIVNESAFTRTMEEPTAYSPAYNNQKSVEYGNGALVKHMGTNIPVDGADNKLETSQPRQASGVLRISHPQHAGPHHKYCIFDSIEAAGNCYFLFSINIIVYVYI